MTMTSVSGSKPSETFQASASRTDACHRHGVTRRRGSIGASVICAALVASSLAAGPVWASSKVTEPFPSTGAEQSFTVPAGVTSVRVSAVGATGATGEAFSPFTSAAPGGDGAVAVAQLPVTPGEVLYVDVANNSFNGGGPGGVAAGNGGGASDVRTVPGASVGTLESRLLVAGGGGGGGSVVEEGSSGRGGDAGSAGGNGIDGERGGPETVLQSAGGGAGTLTGGGAGGALCQAPEFWSGVDGELGLGGRGGDGAGSPSSGGGGGGGYWGGGGGEGTCGLAGPFGGGGGGGGGGSSFVSEEATSASFGLASPSTAPSVTISYATPSTATPDTAAVAFPGTQPLSTVSAPQTITLTNSGGNPLAIDAETFAGSTPSLSSDHPEDFMIDSSSCLGAIGFEASCQLKVRFAPQATGAATATLQIAGNMGAGPTVIALTGTGGTLPQGPQGAAGSTGPQGAQGETGAQGASGAQGETGAQGGSGAQGASGAQGTPGQTGVAGIQGPAGETGKPGVVGPQGTQGPAGPKGERGPQGATATYVCHPRKRNGKYRQACFVSLGSASASAVSGTLERKGVTYASGAVRRSASAGGLLLKASRKIPVGRYTLVLVSSKRGISRETVTVG